jgi:hypothetical protein
MSGRYRRTTAEDERSGSIRRPIAGIKFLIRESNHQPRRKSVFHGIGATLADAGLDDLGEWIWQPVFWYGVLAPVALLATVTIYLFWLNYKARRLYRLNARQKSPLPPRKAPRKKVR